MEFSQESVAFFVGIVLSLVLELTPYLNAKWDALPKDSKRFINSLLVVLASIGVSFIQCQVYAVCEDNTLQNAIEMVTAVFVGNAVGYRTVSRPYRETRQAKEIS